MNEEILEATQDTAVRTLIKLAKNGSDERIRLDAARELSYMTIALNRNSKDKDN